MTPSFDIFTTISTEILREQLVEITGGLFWNGRIDFWWLPAWRFLV